MTVIPNLELIRPETVEEALSEAAADPDGSAFLGGGTDLLVALKLGLAAPNRLIDLTCIPEIAEMGNDPDGQLVLGACVRLADLLSSEELRLRFTALWEAASLVGSPQLRSSGTLGGNICLNTRCTFYNQTPLWRERHGACFKTGGDECHAALHSDRCRAVLSADTPPALAVLGAQVIFASLASSGLVRESAAVTDLYPADGIRSAAGPQRLLTGVQLPRPPAGYRSGYAKYRLRRSVDFPLASVAAGLRLEDGLLRDVRVVLGAVASRLIVVEEIGGLLEGCEPGAEVFARAAAVAEGMAEPVSNLAGSVEQRRHMVGVMTRRLLTRLSHKYVEGRE